MWKAVNQTISLPRRQSSSRFDHNKKVGGIRSPPWPTRYFDLDLIENMWHRLKRKYGVDAKNLQSLWSILTKIGTNQLTLVNWLLISSIPWRETKLLLPPIWMNEVWVHTPLILSQCIIINIPFVIILISIKWMNGIEVNVRIKHLNREEHLFVDTHTWTDLFACGVENSSPETFDTRQENYFRTYASGSKKNQTPQRG